MTDFDLDDVATELFAASSSGRPVELFTERFCGFDWEDARRVAKATDRLRLEAGDTQIGWKLGWTSAAMRQALGIDRPNWGTLWQSQTIAPGDGLDLKNFIHPKIEPELVWRCPVDLGGSDVTATDIAEVGGQWALGLEVVDPRFPSFTFDALDNTADNSSSAAIALGDFTSATTLAEQSIDPDELTVAFSDGAESRDGVGSNAMTSPLEAVAWFVRAMADESLPLAAGDIVFTGGLTAPFDVSSGVTYQLTGPPLDPVSLAVT